MQEFHAFSVSPQKEHKLEIPEGSGFHLSVVSLPRGANGKTTVYVSTDGKSYALASLDSQHNVLQAPTDLIFNYQQQVTFFAKGSATAHCIGYRQELDLNDDDDASFAMDHGSDDDASGTEEAMSLPVDAITNTKPARKRVADAAAAGASEEEDEEHTDSALDGSEDVSSDDDNDDDEVIDSDIAEEPKGMQARPTDPTAPSSEDDEEDTDVEMDSDDLAAMDEEDEDEEDEDDDEEDEDEEEDEEEEVQPPVKSMRTEGRPNGVSSPNRLNGSYSKGRTSGSGSPKGRRSF